MWTVYGLLGVLVVWSVYSGYCIARLHKRLQNIINNEADPVVQQQLWQHYANYNNRKQFTYTVRNASLLAILSRAQK